VTIVRSIDLNISVNQEVESIQNGTEFFPPFKKLQTDSKTIFAFMYNIKNEENEQKEDE